MLTIDLDRDGVKSARRALDVGSGGGRHAFALLKQGSGVVVLDSSKKDVMSATAMIAAMRETGEVLSCTESQGIVGDALCLPFSDESFDLVVASEVLEHIVEDRRAIGEFARVLEPGGTLAVSVPRTGPEAVNWLLSRRYHEVDGGHVRIYRRAQLLARVTDEGFDLVGTHYRHGLHSPYWWLRCAVGVDNEENVLVAAYHRFLVWDIEHRPMITAMFDKVLDPLIGKSLVCYFKKVT